jgi:hypothetical protein
LTLVPELTEFAVALQPILLLALAGACIAAWPAAHAISAPGPRRDRLLAWLAPGSPGGRSAGMLAGTWRALDHRLDDAGRFWSGPCFDRCALFVLPLPILCQLLAWIVFGWAEPLGTRLGMAPQAAPWQRMLAASGVVAVLFCYGCMASGGLLRRLFWGIAAFVIAAEIARFLAGANAAGATCAVVALGAIAIESRPRNKGRLASPGLGLVVAALGVAAGVLGLHARFALPPNESFSLVLIAIFLPWYLVLLAGHVAFRRGWLGLAWGIAWLLAILACLGILRLGARYEAPYATLTMTAVFTLLPLVLLPFIFTTLGIGRALHRLGLSAWPVAMGLLHAILSAIIVPVFAAALCLALITVDMLAVSVGNFEVFDAFDMLDTLRLLPGLVAFASVHFILLTPMIPSLGVIAIAMAGPVGRCFRTPHAALLARLRADDVPGGSAWGRRTSHAMLVALVAAEVFLAILLALLPAAGMLAGFLALMPAAPQDFLEGLTSLGIAFARRVWPAA